jgi:hypothetical protein
MSPTTRILFLSPPPPFPGMDLRKAQEETLTNMTTFGEVQSLPIPEAAQTALQAPPNALITTHVAQDVRRSRVAWIASQLHLILETNPLSLMDPVARYDVLPGPPGSEMKAEQVLDAYNKASMAFGGPTGPRYPFGERPPPGGTDYFVNRRGELQRNYAVPAGFLPLDGRVEIVSGRPSPLGRKAITTDYTITSLDDCFAEAVGTVRDAAADEDILKRLPVTHPSVVDFVRLYPDRGVENSIDPLKALGLTPGSKAASDFTNLAEEIRKHRQAEQQHTSLGGGSGVGGGRTGRYPMPHSTPVDREANIQAAAARAAAEKEQKAELRLAFRIAEVARVKKSVEWQLIERTLKADPSLSVPPNLTPPSVGHTSKEMATQQHWDAQMKNWRSVLLKVNKDNVKAKLTLQPKSDGNATGSSGTTAAADADKASAGETTPARTATSPTPEATAAAGSTTPSSGKKTLNPAAVAFVPGGSSAGQSPPGSERSTSQNPPESAPSSKGGSAARSNNEE